MTNSSQTMIEQTPILQWLAGFLEDLAGRKGCTDITLESNGRFAVRVFGRWESTYLVDLQDKWSEIVASFKPAKAVGKFGYTTTVAMGSRRLRVNYALQVKGEAFSLRPLPAKVLAPEDLMIPPELVDYFTASKGGLILVGGRTGMGKSTTIASLIERRAHTVGGKYVAIENPIEYHYADCEHGFFFQREIGVHVESYSKGISEAMHQNPDVIIIQEILDSESGDAALAAALTGHLVVATLHAYTAATLPQRFLAILGSDPDMQSNWSDALASCLQAAVVQELLPGREGLVPIHEILFCQDKERKPITGVQSLLRKGNWTGLRQEIESGKNRYGMMTFRESREERIRDGMFDR